MEEKKGQVNSLLEEGWFFGNSLLSRSRSAKIMVRCNSDPSPCSSSSKEKISVPQDPSNMSNLLRTPSLPVSFGRDTKYEVQQVNEEVVVEEEDEEEEEEPSMGDLIMQAMPMPIPKRLDRAPSLPPCRGKDGNSNIPAGPIGGPAGRLTRRVSIDSSILLSEKGPMLPERGSVLPEKGPIGMIKLTRRASIDSSMVLPPRYSSKGTKQGASNSKSRPQRKSDHLMINSPLKPENKIQILDKTKSQKSLSDLEIEELQGFKDLGFSFDNKEVSPSVAQILPALQRKASIDSNLGECSNNNKVRRPSLSEVLQRQPSLQSTGPSMPRRIDQKTPSAEDMKAQIKFWARTVASNVRQEC